MTVAEQFGMAPTDITPDFQLGIRQWEIWAKMTNGQRTEANRLMAQGTVASKAIPQARKG